MRYRIIIVTTFILSLSGCATFPVENIKKIDPKNKIAVFSYVGNDLGVIHQYGPTIFNFRLRTIRMDDWGINQYIENKVIDLTKNNSKFNFVKFESRIYRDQIKGIKRNTTMNEMEVIASPELFYRMASSVGADYVLLITVNGALKNSDGRGVAYHYTNYNSQLKVNYIFTLFDPKQMSSIAKVAHWHIEKPLYAISFPDSDVKMTSWLNKKLKSLQKEYLPMLDVVIRHSLEKMTFIPPKGDDREYRHN